MAERIAEDMHVGALLAVPGVLDCVARHFETTVREMYDEAREDEEG
jgi:hypothetical protein